MDTSPLYFILKHFIVCLWFVFILLSGHRKKRLEIFSLSAIFLNFLVGTLIIFPLFYLFWSGVDLNSSKGIFYSIPTFILAEFPPDLGLKLLRLPVYFVSFYFLLLFALFSLHLNAYVLFFFLDYIESDYKKACKNIFGPYSLLILFLNSSYFNRSVVVFLCYFNYFAFNFGYDLAFLLKAHVLFCLMAYLPCWVQYMFIRAYSASFYFDFIISFKSYVLQVAFFSGCALAYSCFFDFALISFLNYGEMSD